MASGTFYNSWGPTNTATDSSVRYHQNHLKVDWSGNDEKVTYTINAYARSGNGSGYYYMADYGVTVTLYCFYPGAKDWTNIGSASGTLNYGNTVANITRTVTINRNHGSQSIKFKAVNTGGSLYTATTETGWDTISARTSYTVSYNANGGTNAPANQTKWYNETLKLSSTEPTRTEVTKDGYTVTFKSNGPGYADTSITQKNKTTYQLATPAWSTNNQGTGTTYILGADYTGNAALTLYARWSPSDENGKIELPTNLIWDRHTFLGWATTTDAVTPNVNSPYEPTSNITLYATWKENYIPAVLTNLKAIRTATTTSTELADEGENAYVTVNWTNGKLTENDIYAPIRLEYTYKKTNGSTNTGSIELNNNKDVTSTSFWIPNLDKDNSWDITTTIIDRNDETLKSSKNTLLSPAFYTMDFLRYGRGISLGGPASLKNTLHCQLSEGITFDGTETGKWRIKRESNGNLSIEWVTS